MKIQVDEAISYYPSYVFEIVNTFLPVSPAKKKSHANNK